MEFDNATFWKRLEEVSGGKSQVQIAKDCGIGLNSDGKGCSKISKWKSGDSIPDIRDLMAIAQTYHCSVDYLVGLSNEKAGKQKDRHDDYVTIGDVLRVISALDKLDIAGTQIDDSNGNADITIFYEKSDLLAQLINTLEEQKRGGVQSEVYSIVYDALIEKYGNVVLGGSTLGFMKIPDDAELPFN